MRRKKSKLQNINKSIMIIGVIFILYVVVGSFLNKIWPSYQNEIFFNISPMIDYYDNDLNLKSNILNNLKSDFLLILVMSLSTLFIFSFPLAIVLFITKGISIGYTINSMILALKIKSIKIILITFFKNIIIIPSMIILLVISFTYLKDILSQKRKNTSFIFNRHMLNMMILLIVSVFLQSSINFLVISLVNIFS